MAFHNSPFCYWGGTGMMGSQDGVNQNVIYHGHTVLKWFNPQSGLFLNFWGVFFVFLIVTDVYFHSDFCGQDTQL